MLLIGSRALLHHYPVVGREPKDWDYLCLDWELDRWILSSLPFITLFERTAKGAHAIMDGEHYEFEIVVQHSGSSGDILLFNSYDESREIANPDELLMLKLSHRYLRNSPYFQKTMQDIHFLRSKGITLTPELVTLLKQREKETYTYDHPNLKQTKQQFFNDTVPYIYDHDSIHRAVVAGARPAYTLFSEDGEEVKSSRTKFDSLSLAARCAAGLEESYVLAIERSLVPFPGALTPRQAFLKALEKVCTSITSGWFREFCWENYRQIASMYDDGYYARFQEALAAGNVLPFKENTYDQ